MKKELKYIDLYAGAGGLSLGLSEAGLRGLFAIEKNFDAFSTLKYNLIDKRKHFDWPEWLPQTNHDIREVLINYKDELMALRGTVDLIVGGPPCQGFSMAGVRDHSDIRNQLVYSYLDMVELVRPNYIFFENVTGFKVKFKYDGLGKSYSEIVINKLKEMGYEVNDYTILMSDFGIPQKRKRFILVGSRIDSNFSNQFETNLISYKDEFLRSKGLAPKTTIEDAINDLLSTFGMIPSFDSSSRFNNGLYGNASSGYQKLMRKNSPKIPDSHRFARHTDDIIKLHKNIQEKIPPGKRISPSDNLVVGLKRRGVTLLDSQGFSPTITSIPDELVHYREPRILTPRETARIQSFPDWYEFKGKYTSGGKLRKYEVPRYTQIGNAVPPLFAEQAGIVLNKLAKPIKAVNYE